MVGKGLGVFYKSQKKKRIVNIFFYDIKGLDECELFCVNKRERKKSKIIFRLNILVPILIFFFEKCVNKNINM